MVWIMLLMGVRGIALVRWVALARVVGIGPVRSAVRRPSARRDILQRTRIKERITLKSNFPRSFLINKKQGFAYKLAQFVRTLVVSKITRTVKIVQPGAVSNAYCNEAKI